MKFLVGGIYQETNTFSPLKETYSAFTRCRGEEILQHPYTAPAGLIREAGHTLVPGVYAHILPSGLLSAEEFQKFLDEFLACCTDDIDGIWLSLHGAMTVEGIGSAEACLVRQLRRRYGDQMPIFGSFDFHGNMSLELVSRMNYITAYYTAPHVDIYETGCRAVRALIRCTEQGILPCCRYVPIPMVMPGELVTTQEDPTRWIQQQLRQLTARYQIPEACLFCGFAWSDCPRNRMSLVLTETGPSPGPEEAVLDLAREIWRLRRDFTYGSAIAAEPHEAVALAGECTGKVLLSDTGDNVTAGCAGDSALLIDAMLRADLRGALAAGIADRPAVGLCFSCRIGERVTCSLGGTIDPGSTRILVTGRLIHRKCYEPRALSGPMRVAVLRVGGLDILICDRRCSFTTRQEIRDAGLTYEDYRVIALKLGYLFPDLASQHPCSILALTPGNAFQCTGQIPYRNGPRQYFPRDDFPFVPGFDPED